MSIYPHIPGKIALCPQIPIPSTFPTSLQNLELSFNSLSGPLLAGWAALSGLLTVCPLCVCAGVRACCHGGMY